jgi:hypothetical protein
VIAQLLETLNVWRNPVFQRYRRSRLRMRKAIFWYLVTAIVALFSTSIDYIVSTNFGQPSMQAARDLWIEILVIQGLILMLKGTGGVAAGLIQDKIDQTIDYQRLTPMTPIRSLIGYLFGLPVLEYVMFAITLPILAFIVIVGQIPITAVVSVYFAFFVCVFLYHITGIAVGLVMQKWIWGYWLSIAMVFLINVVLPAFVSQLGLKFLQYLSVWPVIGQEVLPLVMSEAQLNFAQFNNPFLSSFDDVPFFNYSLSAFWFTVLLQSLLIGTFVTMALRRWSSTSRHALSKPFALGFLAGFIVLFMGNLWPAITGQYLPFALFGERDINRVAEVVAVGLPLVYCLAVWLLCIILYAHVIPTHHSVVRGIRRAFKLGHPRADTWDDDSGNLLPLACFVGLAMAGYWILSNQMVGAGFFDALPQPQLTRWLPIALVLTLTYTGLLIQVVQHKPTVLVVLLMWALPILVAIVLGAAMQAVTPLHTVIASISPIATVLLSGLVVLDGAVPVDASSEFDAAYAGIYTGLLFLLAQIAFLAYRWRELSRGFYATCRAQVPPAGRPESLRADDPVEPSLRRA